MSRVMSQEQIEEKSKKKPWRKRSCVSGRRRRG